MVSRLAVAVVKALLAGLVSLVVVSFIVFVAVEALPGDAATRLLGVNARPERVIELRERLGLDRSVFNRYGSWLADVFAGDLGVTVAGGSTVVDTIERPARNTAVLAGFAGVGAVLIALVVGVLTGARDNGGDGVTRTINLAFVAVPDFVIATCLVTFVAPRLEWVPAVSLIPAGGSALDRPSVLVIPVATIALSAGAFGARLVRVVVNDVWQSPHVQAALTAGIPTRRVIGRHVLGPALGPLLRVLVLLCPYVVGGTAAVERIVGYPGLGTLLAESISASDVRVIEAIVLLTATAVVFAFVLSDLIARSFDARAGGRLW